VYGIFKWLLKSVLKEKKQREQNNTREKCLLKINTYDKSDTLVLFPDDVVIHVILNEMIFSASG